MLHDQITLKNKKRIYINEHIIHNFNNVKDKEFLLCAEGQ